MDVIPLPKECEVLVIGAGVAGATSAHALAAAGVRDICVIESGTSGVGFSSARGSSPDSPVYPNNLYSGSAVMSDPTSTIKMMVTVYPSSSEDFISHHGVEGARRYLNLASRGIELQKALAAQVLPNPETQLVQMGSLYVTDDAHQSELMEEFNTLQSLGCQVELWDKARLDAIEGGNAAGFNIGIYFPNDAVINSSLYAQGLLRSCVSTGSVRLVEGCSRAVTVDTVGDLAVTTLETGVQITSKYVVVATGGFFVGSPDLAGILRPCFSYLVSVPEPDVSTVESAVNARNSVNLFTWGFSHDWCLTKGHFRCSGEDHFSALKPPQWEKRCESLARWTAAKYPYLLDGKDFSALKYDSKFGVYSETPDSAPLVGRPSDASRVCYVLGCNAWGQASMSYAGHLVPGLLGYEELSEEQKDSMSVLSIRRFALLPSVNA